MERIFEVILLGAMYGAIQLMYNRAKKKHKNLEITLLQIRHRLERVTELNLQGIDDVRMSVREIKISLEDLKVEKVVVAPIKKKKA